MVHQFFGHANGLIAGTIDEDSSVPPALVIVTGVYDSRNSDG